MPQYHEREHCDPQPGGHGNPQPGGHGNPQPGGHGNPQRFMQWKFTSCRYNIENSNGFNTYSMSEGLSREDKDDLIRCAGSYTPPDHLPFHPTQEEIDALFPVAFASFPLRSGKWAVTRTVYIGKDYAGVRWGNFFSHGIICPASRWPFSPIRLWNSPLFAAGLTHEELQEHAPMPLPQLTIDESDLLDFSTVIPRFLGDLRMREQALFPLLEAVRNIPSSGKTVVLRDEPEHLPLWLAAIQYAFPLRMAAGISFTTGCGTQCSLSRHTLSHSQRFHVTCTSPEGHGIPLKSPSLKASFHVFDFSEETVATSSESTSGAGSNATRHAYLDMIRCDEVAYPGHELLELHPFINQCDCTLFDGSLDHCVLLYQFLDQPWKEIPSPENFKAMLDFFSTQPLPLRLKLGAEILKKNIRFTAGMLRILFPHLLDVAAKSDADQEITKLFFTFLIKHFVRDIGRPDTPDRMECFPLLDAFLNPMSRDMKTAFFECVYGIVVTSENRQPLLFLYLSLILCLYANRETAYRDYFKVLLETPFEEREFGFFVNGIIDRLIDQAVAPVVYEQMVKLHVANTPHGKDKYDFIDEYDYIPRLKRHGLNRWREGKPAGPQGVAFVRYVLGIRDREEWSAWEYHSNILVYLLEIPFIDTQAKTNAFAMICDQMKEAKMPLDPNDENRLKYGLLQCKTWEKWFRENMAMIIFLGIIVLAAIFIGLFVFLFHGFFTA